MHSTRVFFMPEAFSLNLRTDVAQVGVSILGKIFITLRKPLRLDKVTSSSVLFTRLKLGACSPCCGKWPSMRTGVPLKVTVVIYISFHCLRHESVISNNRVILRGVSSCCDKCLMPLRETNYGLQAVP